MLQPNPPRCRLRAGARRLRDRAGLRAQADIGVAPPHRSCRRPGSAVVSDASPRRLVAAVSRIRSSTAWCPMRSPRIPTSGSPSPIWPRRARHLREARGAREPQVGVGGERPIRPPARSGLPGDKRTDVQVDVGLDVAYEVDLFGRVSRSIEAARGDVGAAASRCGRSPGGDRRRDRARLCRRCLFGRAHRRRASDRRVARPIARR